MRLFYSLGKILSLVLIIFWVASCTPKTKTEQPAEKPDSVKQATTKVETPPKKDSVAEKPLEKKEVKPAIAEKKITETIPVKPEVKKNL